jgi:hypothetical protein
VVSFWVSRVSRLGFGLVLAVAAGAATAIVIILIGSGVFWLYIYGDDPWPSLALTILTVAAYGAAFVVSVITLFQWLRRPKQ